MYTLCVYVPMFLFKLSLILCQSGVEYLVFMSSDEVASILSADKYT